jgi:hypothetical protein
MSVASEPHPRVGILMGADSDWPVMQVAARSSDELGVPYEARVVSAHRTPELLFDHAERARGRDLAAIVASAGGVVAFPTETVYGLGADAQRGRGAAGVRPQGSARRSPPHRASGRDRPGRCLGRRDTGTRAAADGALLAGAAHLRYCRRATMCRG